MVFLPDVFLRSLRINHISYLHSKATLFSPQQFNLYIVCVCQPASWFACRTAAFTLYGPFFSASRVGYAHCFTRANSGHHSGDQGGVGCRTWMRIAAANSDDWVPHAESPSNWPWIPQYIKRAWNASSPVQETVTAATAGSRAIHPGLLVTKELDKALESR